MADKRVFLKVKLKSLAEEARIIKHEESKRKCPRWRYATLKGKNTFEAGKNMARSVRDDSRRVSARRRASDWYPMSAQQLHELHRHRIDVVRLESRLSGIAYAVIRGRALAKVDSLNGLEPRHWERVQAMLKKYGNAECPVTKSMTSMKPAELFEAMAESGKGLAVQQAA